MSVSIRKLYIVAISIVALTTNSIVFSDPGAVVDCNLPQNLSSSPDDTSIDPLLLTDSSGGVHLFWAERLFGDTEVAAQGPDSLIYSNWDGQNWSSPTDVFISPLEYNIRRVMGIRGVADDNNNIHVVWIGPENTLFVNSVQADKAGIAGEWRSTQLLSTDQSGAQYSADIVFETPATLHVIYGREPAESNNQSVVYVRSEDGGLSWTEPLTIYTVPYIDRGMSNSRLLVSGSGNIFASWTEWDVGGNGQIIFFSRSLDGGESWEEPIILDERKGIEYERDWTTLAELDDGRLVVFWEGGHRAYRQAQYSEDDGLTWSEPIDTLDWLIGDNGFAEFVRDGDGRLHVFSSLRIREGNIDKQALAGDEVGGGIWHSVWEGGNEWRQPELLPNTDGNWVSPVVRGGNELFLAWFSYTTFEIYVMHCRIDGAQDVVPQSQTSSDEDSVAIVPTTSSAVEFAPTVVAPENLNLDSGAIVQDDLITTLMTAIFPVLMIISVFFLIVLFRNRIH